MNNRIPPELTVATGSEGEPQKKPGTSVTIEQLKEHATVLGTNVNTVLRIIQVVQSFTLLPTTEEIENNPALKKRYDGGVSAAAEVTIINACARLDALLDIPGLWESKVVFDPAELKLRLDTEDQNRLNALEQARPCFRNGVQVYQMNVGSQFPFAAKTPIHNTITAYGNSPAEALANWDKIFLHGNNEQNPPAAS